MAKHTAHILTDAGDVTVSWDPKNPADVADAKRVFKEFLEKGYEAYEFIDGEPTLADRLFKTKPGQEQIVKSFDETIGKLILRQKVVLAPTAVVGGYPAPGMNQGRL